jgi:hypothetical protein
MNKEMVDPKEVTSESEVWLKDMQAKKKARMKECNSVMKMSGVLGMHWGEKKAEENNKSKKNDKKQNQKDLDNQRKKEEDSFYKNLNGMI